jgi:Zn finger protein HypA/HybF involved in hydrogenase expression
MMARQIIGGETEIALPEYKDSVSEYLPQFGRMINEVFTISEQQKIILSNVQIEHDYLGIPVDVLGRVGEFSFIIYFTHPGRDVPLKFFNPHNAKCGIISVSLAELPILFRSAHISKGSYHTILHDFLLNNTSSKEWVFHPRYRRCEQDAKSKLEKQKAQLMQSRRLSNTVESDSFTPTSENTIIDDPVVATTKKLAVYECVMCHTTWQGWEPSGSICPKCNTHLYRTLKRYVGNET